MDRTLQRTLIALLVLFLLPVVAIYGLYFVGTRQIAAGFEATRVSYPDNVRLALWRSLGGTGTPRAERITPIGVALDFSKMAWSHDFDSRMPPGQSLAARVASGARSVDNGANHHLMHVAAMIQASRWPVDRQLDTVLDRMVFDAGRVGIDAGARRIFGKRTAQLSEAELQVLLAVDRAPSAFDPWCHEGRLRKRVSEQLAQGITDATPAELDRALASILAMPADHARCATGH